jgi:hypothetical protein
VFIHRISLNFRVHGKFLILEDSFISALRGREMFVSYDAGLGYDKMAGWISATLVSCLVLLLCYIFGGCCKQLCLGTDNDKYKGIFKGTKSLHIQWHKLFLLWTLMS